MALTPKQLIDELAKTGRHVSKRLLTDWRQRRLLPELTHKGRGPGKGASYFWEQANILDQAVFIADLPSWNTPQIIFALWCSEFDVPPEAIREAWLDAIERLSRSWAKQDMDAPTEGEAQFYFERMEDNFHKLATSFVRLKRAEGDDMAEFAYQMVQLAFALLFGEAISEDLEGELFEINQHLKWYKPKFGKYREFGLPAIEFEVVLALRRFANVFEMRDAICEATPAQIAEAQFIWGIICRAFIIFAGAEPSPHLGLTAARIAQGTLGPPLLSCLIVALRTAGEAPLVRLFHVIAEQLDKMEMARKAGQWADANDLARHSNLIDPEFGPTITALWHQFCAGITDGAGMP